MQGAREFVAHFMNSFNEYAICKEVLENRNYT